MAMGLGNVSFTLFHQTSMTARAKREKGLVAFYAYCDHVFPGMLDDTDKTWFEAIIDDIPDVGVAWRRKRDDLYGFAAVQMYFFKGWDE
jgi:hypothetical protein